MTEHKMVAPNAEVRAALSEFLGAFEAFKEVNDRRLGELEKRGEDVVTRDKLSRIDSALTEQKAALDRLAVDRAAPLTDGGESGFGAQPSERKTAFDAYVRKGATSGVLETKDLSVGTPGAGGYVAPDELEQLITQRLTASSPMRSIASVRQVGANHFKKPVSIGGATAGWAAETAQRTGTDEPTLVLLDFPTRELYALPAATQSLLDDAFVDIDAWLAGEIETAFSAAESKEFITGEGTSGPKGILGYTEKADASAVWGEMGYVATGAAGAFGDDPIDALIDLVYAPKAIFRANGRFVMNKSTVSAVRKVKDSDGNYIWQPSVDAAGEARLLGYPITEAEDMPPIGSNAYAVAFGDFQRGYLIVDRVGVTVLRDPYTAKPYVLFYTTKRVGGGVQNFDAIKLLKFAES